MRKLIMLLISTVTILFSSTAFAEMICPDTIAGFAEALSTSINEQENSSSEDNSISIASCEPDDDPFASKRIVVFTYAGLSKDYGAEKVLFDGDNMYILLYATESEAKRAFNGFAADTSIDQVMPDYDIFVTPDTLRTDEVVTSATAPDHLSWGAGFIGADNYNSYLMELYDSVEEMPEITIAVIDTGVADENDVFYDLNGNTRVQWDKGYNFIDPDQKPVDDNSHGTHVSGILCDLTLDNIKIIPYKTMNQDGRGSISTIVTAAKLAIAPAEEGGGDADVVNMSLCGKDSSYTYRRKYSSQFENSDKIFVAAAGNKCDDLKYYFPSNVANVLAVSACDSSGTFDDSYSNYGTLVDLCAPGTAIRSTVPISDKFPDGYDIMDGTSMACPHVAAAAAMVKTQYPDMAAADIADMLKQSAIRTDDQPYDEYYGYGLLSLNGFVPQSSMIESIAVSDTNVSVMLNGENGEFNNSAVVNFAGFNDGQLTGYQSESVFFGTSTVLMNFKCRPSSFDEIKLMVWDSFDSMRPLCDTSSVKTNQ